MATVGDTYQESPDVEPHLDTDKAEYMESSPSMYLCLTILGYRKAGMSEAAYRHHMNTVSAPMTKDLLTKYGVKRWTVVSLSGRVMQDRITTGSILCWQSYPYISTV